MASISCSLTVWMCRASQPESAQEGGTQSIIFQLCENSEDVQNVSGLELLPVLHATLLKKAENHVPALAKQGQGGEHLDNLLTGFHSLPLVHKANPELVCGSHVLLLVLVEIGHNVDCPAYLGDLQLRNVFKELL